MRPRRWFLPDTPDVVGMLGEQTAITVEGMRALVAWAEGDESAAERIRDCEHRADDKKGELRKALTEAFTTPLEPEDLFELSRGIDDVLNGAKNVVREMEVMGRGPDAPTAEMARELAAGSEEVAAALVALKANLIDEATAAADRAIKSERNVEHSYRRAMSALIDIEDIHEVAARRELYRRLARISDDLARAGERVWYSMLKES